MVIAAAGADRRLDTLVQSIVARLEPEMVLLFGSRARGDAREDSDYDLMLVFPDGVDVESALSAANDAARAAKVFAEIMACTAAEYQRRQHDPGFMQWVVAREGRLLFGRGNMPQYSPRTDRVREQPREGLEVWLARAEGDFRSALELSASEDPVWASVCFHAHACVEKLLKALLVAQGRFPPRTHELEDLIALAAPALLGEVPFVADCKTLQDVYPKSRYVPHPLPTPEEGRRAIEAARRARHRLLTELERQ